jgi:hypothetical protein
MGRARDMGAIHPSKVKRMLHDILWNGLRKDLKDASGHKYDSIKDFDSLRVAIRQIEMKHTLEQQLYEKEIEQPLYEKEKEQLYEKERSPNQILLRLPK